MGVSYYINSGIPHSLILFYIIINSSVYGTFLKIPNNPPTFKFDPISKVCCHRKALHAIHKALQKVLSSRLIPTQLTYTLPSILRAKRFKKLQALSARSLTLLMFSWDWYDKGFFNLKSWGFNWFQNEESFSFSRRNSWKTRNFGHLTSKKITFL